MIDIIKRHQTLLALLGFALFIVVVLPYEQARLFAATGMSTSPDTSFFYSADTLYTLAGAYGEAGRSAYIASRLRFDILWPLVYGLFFWTQLKTRTPRLSIRLLPWLAVGFDLLENTLVSWVFYRYPQTTVLAHVAGVATLLKWTTLSLAVVFIVGFYGWAFKRVLGGKK